MTRTYIYVIAFAPVALDPADQALRFKHHILTADDANQAFAIGQHWAEREGILPLQGPGNDQVIELNPLDDRDLQLAHDLANLRQTMLATVTRRDIEDIAERIARCERLIVNSVMCAFGLPLLPVRPSHPLPVHEGAPRKFSPPAVTETGTEGHA
jgi:hypothetical protein